MKGIKYNLKFKKPDNEICEKTGLNMTELCDTVKENFRSNYFLEDIKVNNQIISNMINRPKTASKLLLSKCEICKC
tara:strand:+ start:738 stop:965 length:228 start_codon:yes stop_codon:yes gene_type:complete